MLAKLLFFIHHTPYFYFVYFIYSYDVHTLLKCAWEKLGGRSSLSITPGGPFYDIKDQAEKIDFCSKPIGNEIVLNLLIEKSHYLM